MGGVDTPLLNLPFVINSLYLSLARSRARSLACSLSLSLPPSLSRRALARARECPEADRALYLLTFSRLLIVKKLLSLFPSPSLSPAITFYVGVNPDAPCPHVLLCRLHLQLLLFLLLVLPVCCRRPSSLLRRLLLPRRLRPCLQEQGFSFQEQSFSIPPHSCAPPEPPPY